MLGTVNVIVVTLIISIAQRGESLRDSPIYTAGERTTVTSEIMQDFGPKKVFQT